MLGVSLLFVGIVLINNGCCALWDISDRSAAIMNFFVGGLSIIVNVISLVQGNYYAAGTGLLFGFTYLYVALIDVFDLDRRPFAVFSCFVAVNAVVFGAIEGLSGSSFLGLEADWRWMAIWWAWAILWGSSFFTDILEKDLRKTVPVLQIVEGVITAWVPGVLLLLGAW